MGEKIPFIDIKKQYLEIKDEIDARLKEVCEAAAFSSGPYVDTFEKEFAEYCGTKYCSGVNSGTSALHLALVALGIKPGDEVIVPANTFIATAWAVSYVNATPVFVDCRKDTWNIDPISVEEKISKRTKAIIGVHLYGQPFNISEIKEIADKNKIFLVEDAAQAHGSRFKGKRVGSFGEMGCFSFYPGKNLGAYGEGGSIITNNEIYDKHIKSLRNHGSNIRYYHDELGYNMRMDGFQGAVLSVKLKYLDKWNNRRREIAKKYHDGISNSRIIMQHQPDWADSIYHLFVITTDDRENLMKYLQNNDIYPGLHYPVPCHLQKAYSHLNYKKGDIPNAEFLAEHCLSLPMYAELSDKEVDKVIETINKYQL